MNNHPFHMVDKSPWPITWSMGVMTTMTGTMMWMNKMSMTLMILGMTISTLTLMQWWWVVTRESTFQGNHTKKVMMNMKTSLKLFILSKFMLSMSFFWEFLHSSLSPNIEIGMEWPPKGIKSMNPMNVPMLNTMILLSSGVSIT